MKIGVLSDTHDRHERAARAAGLLREAGARALFHCGDITVPAVIDACALLPLYVVLGNNDRDREGIARRVEERGGVFLGEGGEVTLAGKRIAATHGHLASVRRRLLERTPDYLLLGHSHRRGGWWEGPTRCLNPGALHRAKPWTCLLLDLESGEERFVVVAADS